jgi:hypothetical protein
MPFEHHVIGNEAELLRSRLAKTVCSYDYANCIPCALRSTSVHVYTIPMLLLLLLLLPAL